MSLKSIVLLLVVTIQCASFIAAEELKTWPVEMIDDADLHDVCFATADDVWAVGDRGALWRSTDAGKNWALLPALTKSALRSIDFAPPLGGTEIQAGRVGMIVGGDAGPNFLPSEGVVFLSSDGGKNWATAKNQLLPALNHVVMEDRRSGIAVGDVWSMFPSALFRTSDGGRSWNNSPSRVSARWVDGDFSIANRSLLVSRGGDAIAAMRTSMGVRHDPAHHISAARWLGEGTAIAVGDQAALLVSNDYAQTWHDLRPALPPGIADQFDFRAIHTAGPNIWVAGSPGTKVLRSEDAGRTWAAVPTGQSLPIVAIDFDPDANSGVAVAALGTKLFTNDGGKSWQPSGDALPGHEAQRRRAAALIVAARPTSLPLDLIAQLSLGNGLRCRVAMLESNLDSVLAVEEAVKTVGGDGVTWIRGFDLPSEEVDLSAEEIERRWRLSHAMRGAARPQRRRGAEHLAHLLVTQIRTWQPDVVIAACSHEKGLDEILELTVEHATGKAKEPGAYADQIAIAGLEPWAVKNAIRAAPRTADAPTASTGTIVDPAEPLTSVASSISARVAAARSFLAPVLRRPGQLAKPTVYVPLDRAKKVNLISDLAVSTASASRRAATVVDGDKNWIIRRGATHHNIQILLSRLVQKHRMSGSAEQLAPLVRELEADEQTRLLYAIAQQFHGAGSTTVAMETIEGILRRQNDDATQHAATLQKIRWSTSPELHRMMSATQQGTNSFQLAGTSRDSPTQQISANVNQTQPLSADELKKLLRGLPPAAKKQEWLQMTEAASRRRGAAAKDQQRIYERLRKTLPNGDWRNCATTETWIADPNPDPRKPIPANLKQIRFAKQPPVLDGTLGEEFWQDATQIALEPQLGSHAAMPATNIRMARDGRYFYVGIECHSYASRTDASTDRRQRDTDLSAHDRVEISIDVNRDYSSGWRLTIDDRGWANDAFERDASWNPKWHIARSSTAKAWLIEAAIPLDEIVDQTKQNPVWLLGVRRVIPKQGISTWPNSESAEIPWQKCGYLLVEQVIHQ